MFAKILEAHLLVCEIYIYLGVDEGTVLVVMWFCGRGTD